MWNKLNVYVLVQKKIALVKERMYVDDRIEKDEQQWNIKFNFTRYYSIDIFDMVINH